ncbi:cytochrome c biogenesis protein ResB [Bacillus smithii]|uniref:cytochrome c biogenesis protein ResB n=1 Tax=Bacillus smithii TaxID=1479 RepID=UPI002E1B2331|nr:cytochrome c biogenesis protein ResB [Bacillus smithii]
MEKVKCDCGHVNPHGTILCEACGRALTEEAKQSKLYNMRYEGSARRSQTYHKTIIDKIWNFFSSVKVGVILIIVTLIASAIGTIFPQKMYIPQNVDPGDYYKQVYGTLGEIYYKLGFYDLYNSVWYITLIALIGVSLVICSLDRVIPLYRALRNQRVVRHESFMKKQRLFAKSSAHHFHEDIEKIKKKLEKKHYRIRMDDEALLAEKGRFSRWGPYVNHIGLIVFLFGAMLRSVDGMYVDKLLWIREGETLEVPGTNGKYYVQNKKFILQEYSKKKDPEVFNQAIDRVGNIAKNYQSNVVLYKNENQGLPGAPPKLKKIKEGAIRVNHPIKLDHYAIYQSSFKLGEPKAMVFTLTDKKTGKEFGTVKVDLFQPKEMYSLGHGYKVKLMGYYPDFSGFANNGEPQSKSPIPNNPAFLFKMFSPEHPDGEVSFVAIRQTIEPLGATDYKMKFKSLETRNVSALTVHKDLTLWILALGGAIFMIGVIQGAYWNHRRIWIRKVDGEVYIAAHTNKNWYGLKKEISSILEGTQLPVPVDQSEKGEEA